MSCYGHCVMERCYALLLLIDQKKVRYCLVQLSLVGFDLCHAMDIALWKGAMHYYY